MDHGRVRQIKLREGRLDMCNDRRLLPDNPIANLPLIG